MRANFCQHYCMAATLRDRVIPILGVTRDFRSAAIVHPSWWSIFASRHDAREDARDGHGNEHSDSGERYLHVRIIVGHKPPGVS